MGNKNSSMKRILFALTLIILIMGCAFAGSNVKVNGVEFELPSKYQGGDVDDNYYRVNNTFAIRCIDDEAPKAIGLWASENEFNEDLDIKNHPVRHFYQFNKYVDGYHSHAYFASGNSLYEISWVGKEIDGNIEKLIKNTPKSEIESEAFYNTLDEATDIYKNQKIDQLNRDSEYNYMESKYSSKLHEQPSRDDTRLNQILLTYRR